MSIRRRLLVWLLSSVLAGGLLAASVVFFQARAEANDLFDYELRQLALTLRDRAFTGSSIADLLQGEEPFDVAIQVWAPNGTRIYASHPNLPVPSVVQLGFSQGETAQGRWRIFAMQQRGLIFQVAQPMVVRERLAIAAAIRTLLPFLVALPLMGLLIWRLVGRELATLEATAAAIARRNADSLAPIEDARVPGEIRPLVASLNGLLARLASALAQQRQFVADAAHELRTPLTALKLQLQLAERARDDGERAAAYATQHEGIARAAHLVEQLLALARQDPDAPMESVEAIDLAALAKSVIEAHGAAAAARSTTLESALLEPLVVEGDRTALRTMGDNLVENAIRHAPPGSRVTVGVYRDGDRACFEVEDDGPGIPPEERGRAFDRFHRIQPPSSRPSEFNPAPEGPRGEGGKLPSPLGEGWDEGHTPGSGLGLAIVRRIAERHGGRAELLDARAGPGLRARVLLPVSARQPLSAA